MSMVFTNKPATVNEVHTNIERVIAAVSIDLCLKIFQNWIQRLDFYKRARSGHANPFLTINFHQLKTSRLLKRVINGSY